MVALRPAGRIGYAEGMHKTSQAGQKAPLDNPIRGQSRYRVIVRRLSQQPKPYGWEIQDDERDLRVARSKERYRTFREAWEAGSEALTGIGR
jgi:hypothetical protein